MRAATRVFALAFLYLAVPAEVDAATMRYLSIEALYAGSDVVVRGVVEGHAAVRDDRGQLFTDWAVRVDEVLQGHAAPRLIVRQVGGRVGPRRVSIPGDAELRDGEEVVLFLVVDADVHYLTALGQAKLTALPSVTRGPTAVPGPTRFLRDLSRIAFVGRERTAPPRRAREVFTLDALRASRPDRAPSDPAGAPR